IALRDDGGRLQLLQTAGTSVIRVPNQVCIGAGQTLGNYLSRLLRTADLSLDAMSVLATQILDQVKKNVPECAGMFNQIVILPKTGPIRRLSPSNILSIEYATRDVIAATKPSLLAMSDPTLSDTQFSVELDNLIIQCKNMRAEQKERLERFRRS